MPWLPTLIATWPAPQTAHRTTSSAAAAGSIAERWLTRDQVSVASSQTGGATGGRHAAKRSRSAAGSGSTRRRRRVLGADEAFPDGVPEEREEPRPVALDVDQAHGLPVDAELGPREDLEDLLERAEAARQRHEAVRQRGHQRLALVHRAHDVELGEAVVG